eukprot:gnl/TRDRNA2_/TRDRNA2_177485_c0_seq1.p1 gnl/TRDRNA2_/TRDRNA2_177485_c0~~gnl/TRDRNA2_/TRDRNA2_177485_c0_seq1.p1  ORF type:complete len:1142 (-),score=332.09 gnl/TRDRNA2_/TRDRNA2_177485_c0_seq1:102-3527(-)
MEAAALAGAAVAGAFSKDTFQYNRENFQYDREMRMTKEFKVMDLRIKQAALWRQDVRDLISLTEKKMASYLMVNVLQIGFCVSLFCQGKLPVGAPDWMMSGYMVANTGAFVYFLLSTWFAVHAAVTAQSYEARILTQLVRLQIPTWSEIEACRTYGSDFEQTEKRQMFRVPFLMGKQGETGTTAKPAASEPAPSGGSEGEQQAAQCTADPWGLEGRGEGIYELGNWQEPGEIARLRHVKIVRNACAYWQSYEAFSRIAMTMGVYHFCVALAMYVLGYMLIQVGASFASWSGVLVCVTISCLVFRLDMSLPRFQYGVVASLIFAGPALAATASYQFKISAGFLDEWEIAISFLANGLFLLVILVLCRVKEQDNGTMVPLAFRSVLYLDVFGWVKEREAAADSPQATGLRASASSQEVAPTSAMMQRGMRPEDVANAGTSLRSTQETAAPGDPTTFYKPGRGMNGGASGEAALGAEQYEPIETGFHSGKPGMVPWRVFSMITLMLAVIWNALAVQHGLAAYSNGWNLDVLLGPVAIDHTAMYQDSESSSFMQMRASEGAGLWEASIGHVSEQQLQKVHVAWPHGNVLPRGMSIDAQGTHLVVSDRFAMFVADMEVAKKSKANPAIEFREMQHCPALMGESLMDVALACGATTENDKVCDALVLHNHGRHVTACPVEAHRDSGATMVISDSWLQRTRDAENGWIDTEKVQSISLNPAVGGEWQGPGGSAFVGTTHGHMVQMRQRSNGGHLLPMAILQESSETVEAPHSGTLHFFNERYAGVLQSKGHSIQVIDMQNGGVVLGKLDLPTTKQFVAFSAGGGHVYLMTKGPESELLRFRVPNLLEPDVSIKRAAAPPLQHQTYGAGIEETLLQKEEDNFGLTAGSSWEEYLNMQETEMEMWEPIPLSEEETVPERHVSLAAGVLLSQDRRYDAYNKRVVAEANGEAVQPEEKPNFGLSQAEALKLKEEQAVEAQLKMRAQVEEVLAAELAAEKATEASASFAKLPSAVSSEIQRQEKATEAELSKFREQTAALAKLEQTAEADNLLSMAEKGAIQHQEASLKQTLDAEKLSAAEEKDETMDELKQKQEEAALQASLKQEREALEAQEQELAERGDSWEEFLNFQDSDTFKHYYALLEKPNDAPNVL